MDPWRYMEFGQHCEGFRIENGYPIRLESVKWITDKIAGIVSLGRARDPFRRRTTGGTGRCS